MKSGQHQSVLVESRAGLTWATAVVHWEPLEPEALAVWNWPVRERVAAQVAAVRTVVWNVRVALSTRGSAAMMAVMLPLYTWTGRHRKRRTQRQEGVRE